MISFALPCQDLSLMLALKKCSFWPAKRLEKCAPAFRNKGRIKVGADADLIVFDAGKIIDHSTFTDAAQYSSGIKYTLVNGVAVVKEGKFLKNIFPGKAARRCLSREPDTERSTGPRRNTGARGRRE